MQATRQENNHNNFDRGTLFLVQTYYKNASYNTRPLSSKHL